jgi:hypothetical protein
MPLSFKQARDYVQCCRLKSKGDWDKWVDTKYRIANIPVNPELHYRDSGWTNWNDWLGITLKDDVK